ncbi:MAG TPA: hypothetical protein VEM57_09360, partial [Candidatus Binatus sp.]|nr:hypothetical protein [Candidatus Binatus sp.]
QCDPTANPPGCPAGVTCSATCTCGGGGGACNCGATAPTKLSFTTAIGSGNCGTIQGNTGTTTKQLKCGGLYTGGGSNTVPLPYAVPDMGQSLTKVASCSGTSLTLANLTQTDTGSNRNCTSAGCLFGPPLPIPNAGSTPTSVCVINTVATNGSGAADCSTGVSSLNLPLTSTLYLTGDLVPTVDGIQPCPICTSGTCKGGANNGQPCTPADSASLGAGFPTSHDCPPPALANIGGLPIAFNLSTGTQTKTAVNNTTSGQNNVFCGFCRDINSAGTGCFAGDPGRPAICPVRAPSRCRAWRSSCPSRDLRPAWFPHRAGAPRGRPGGQPRGEA